MELTELSWAQAKDAISKAKVALLPIGAVENHGPHLALGTDWFCACGIAEEASKRGGWLILPGLPVGISEHHRQFWGTLWVPPDVLRDYVLGLVRSLASYGLRRVVLVNGHGGNTACLDQALRIARHENIHMFVYEWWNAIPELITELCQLPHDHAGDMETSMILTIDPSLVNKDKYAEASATNVTTWGKMLHGVPVALDTIDFTKTGNVGDPSYATAEKGRKLLDASAEHLHLFCKWLSEQPEESLKPKPHAA